MDSTGTFLLGGLVGVAAVVLYQLGKDDGAKPNPALPQTTIKGDRIKLQMQSGKILPMPASYGFFQSPHRKCDVLIGPYRAASGTVPLTFAQKEYFGANYTGKVARITVPEGPWKRVGDVIQIFYKRPAANHDARYPGRYYHPFKVPVHLLRCGSFYKLSMKDGCILNWRGFVYP